MNKGMRLAITGFTGPYTLPDDIESKTDHLVHLCAGSGSVPNLSILKHSLKFQPKLRHTFLYSNKTWDDVIFRSQLQALEAEYPDRLQVVHSLTRETDASIFGPRVRKGRITNEVLREFIPDPNACVVYACGPAVSTWDRAAAKAAGVEPTPRFMESVVAGLREIGVPNDRVKRESYG
jgi:ferredoxin-NADP reductase